jgi:hypothetical protein
LRLLAQALHPVSELDGKVIDIAAAEVSKLDMLEVRPDHLVGVQVGRVSGEALQVQPSRSSSGEKVLHDLSAVDSVAVPNDRQLPRNEPKEMSEERHHVLALVGAVLDVEEQLPIERDRADRGEVVVRVVLPQNGRLPGGSVGSNYSRERVEARFIREEDRP